MNTSASRGAILVIIATIVGVIVLGKGFDSDASFESVAAGGTSAANDSASEPTPTPGDDATVDTDGDGVPDAPADTTPPLTPQPRPPAEVRVLVANGTAINGAAGVATDKLIARNYATLTPTNADNVEVTTIYYEADYEADALLVAQYLSAQPSQVAPLPATDPGGVDRRGANILVILGADEVTQPAEPETTG